MGPSDYRTYGWWYTVAGLGLLVGGVASLFDPTSSKIYLGAILVGPFLFFRGLFFLREYYRLRSSPLVLPEGQPAAQAAELYRRAIRQGLPAKEVACEACKQEYIYFPELAAEAQAAKQGPDVAKNMGMVAVLQDCAIAPCPRCGWIQQEMFPLAREQARLSFMMLAGILVTFSSAL